MHKRCERRAVDGKDHAITRAPTAHRRVRAEPGRSEHRNVDTLIPSRRQGESQACPHVPCERRPHPQPKVRKLERDRVAASFGREHQKPARGAKAESSELPCERRDDPPPKVRRRSGIVPERALEANTKKKSRAQRKGGVFRASLRAQDRSRGAPQRQPTSLMSRCQSLPSLTRTAEPSCR